MILDIVLFSVFLIVNLLIGLWSGRKVTTLRQYAIGGKRFSTGMITASIVATGIGGELICNGLRHTYSRGFLFILPGLLGKCISYWLTARIVVVYMGSFLGHLSIAEFMGERYGKVVRIMTALSGISMMTMGVAIQFQSIVEIVGLVFGLQGTWIALVTAAIVIVYSSFGGIYSVTLTDVGQFIAICICLPILVLTMYHSCTGPNQLATLFTTHPLLSWQQLKGLVGLNKTFIQFLSFSFFLSLPLHVAHPAFFQRIAMSSSVYQARKSFTYAAFFTFPIIALVCFLGIVLLSHKATLKPTRLVQYVIGICVSYPGLKGLLAMTIVALAISTADSYLNASSVLCVHDIIQPLQGKKEGRHALTMARVCSCLIGLVALLLSYRYYSKIFHLIFFFLTLIRATYSLPLFLSIFGFRTTPAAVLSGMVAGGIAVVCWHFGVSARDSGRMVVGLLTNGIVLGVIHYVWPDSQEKRGWVGVPDATYLLETFCKKKRAWWLFGLYPGKKWNFYTYCQRLLPKSEASYPAFSLYALFTIYIPYFQKQGFLMEKFPQLHAGILHSVLVLVAIFMTYPACPTAWHRKPFMVFCWPIGVGYILFGLRVVFLLLSGFQAIQLIIWVANLLLASMLIPWQAMLFLMGFGGGLALILIKLAGVPFVCFLSESLTLEFKIVYSVLLFFSLLMMLYKNHQEKRLLKQTSAYQEAISRANKADWLHNLKYQAYVKDILYAQNEPLQFVKEALYTLERRVPEAGKTAQKACEQLDAFITYYKNSFYHSMDYLLLQVKQVAIDELLANVATSAKLLGLTELVQVRIATQYTHITCDVDKITLLLVNTLQCLQPKEKPIVMLTLVLYDTTLSYQFQAVPDQRYMRNIPAIGFVLTNVQVPFPIQSCYQGNTGQIEMKVPQTLADLPQHQNERIMDAHYGYSEVITDATAIQWLYVLPVDVRSIRSKIADELPVVAEGPLDNAVSLAAEEALLRQIKEKTTLDLTVARGAIAHIKRIHQGQFRKSGDLFYTHPLTVASILLTMTQDPDVIVAALLHDTVEDTVLSLDQVKYQYGQTVAFIVSKVTHLDPTGKKTQLTEAENQQQLWAVQDPRVVMLKLADRLHNMRTSGCHSSQKQHYIAQETLDFYVPLGRRMGMAVVDPVVDEIEAHCRAFIRSFVMKKDGGMEGGESGEGGIGNTK